MNIATTFAAAESQLTPAAIQDTIGRMVIPARPAVNAMPAGVPGLTRIYDTASKRSDAMARISKTTKLVDMGLAQMFGLFCDVGIPLLMARFPD